MKAYIGAMEKLTLAQQKDYIARQKEGFEFIERERIKALRNRTDDETRDVIASLFSYFKPAASNRVCGLIEQQQLFHNLPDD